MRILIAGTGRVARALVRALAGTDITLAGIAGRDRHKALELAAGAGCAGFDLSGPLPVVDLVLIAVKDDAIANVASGLDIHDAVVAHTSGASSEDLLLPHRERGVCWPVQTFHGADDVPMAGVPIIYSGATDRSRELLRRLAEILKGRPLELELEQRQHLHVAAVFTSNFTVALVREAQELLHRSGLPVDLLDPLWRTTATNVCTMGPGNALTGPARRGDLRTLERHRELLAADPELQELYARISGLIMRRER
jgi:predicted short-subunit dehydrogenase-like oxidoreductase (DUF2520 family)